MEPRPIAILAMQLRDLWFALEARSVIEVLGEQRWALLPDAPRELPGVLSWHGRAIALLDLGALTGALLPLSASDRHPRTLVLSEAGCILALPVDVVREIAEVGRDELRPPQAAQERYSCAEVELAGTIMPLLNLAAVVASFTRE